MITWIINWVTDLALPLLVIGVAVLILSNFIPTVYRVCSQGIAVLVISSCAFLLGSADERADWKEKMDKIELANSQLKTKTETLTKDLEVAYTKNKALIKQKGRVVYVDRYITKEDDNKCDISDGFVRLYNDSIEGTVSGTSSGDDGAPGKQSQETPNGSKSSAK